jgi:hypothetical protein
MDGSDVRPKLHTLENLGCVSGTRVRRDGWRDGRGERERERERDREEEGVLTASGAGCTPFESYRLLRCRKGLATARRQCRVRADMKHWNGLCSTLDR